MDNAASDGVLRLIRSIITHSALRDHGAGRAHSIRVHSLDGLLVGNAAMGGTRVVVNYTIVHRLGQGLVRFLRYGGVLALEKSIVLSIGPSWSPSVPSSSIAPGCAACISST